MRIWYNSNKFSYRVLLLRGSSSADWWSRIHCNQIKNFELGCFNKQSFLFLLSTVLVFQILLATTIWWIFTWLFLGCRKSDLFHVVSFNTVGALKLSLELLLNERNSKNLKFCLAPRRNPFNEKKFALQIN